MVVTPCGNLLLKLFLREFLLRELAVAEDVNEYRMTQGKTPFFCVYCKNVR